MRCFEERRHEQRKLESRVVDHKRSGTGGAMHELIRRAMLRWALAGAVLLAGCERAGSGVSVLVSDAGRGDVNAAAAAADVAARAGSAPVGTTFSVTLNQTLSAQTGRVGDVFTATLREPLRDGAGNAVVPAGAAVRGRLTEVARAGTLGESAVLRLAFESVSFFGRSLALEGTVMRAEPQRRLRPGVQPDSARSAAGAEPAPGRVLEAGAESGAAASGTAIAMGTTSVDVVLPAGSELVIRLDAPVATVQ